MKNVQVQFVNQPLGSLHPIGKAFAGIGDTDKLQFSVLRRGGYGDFSFSSKLSLPTDTVVRVLYNNSVEYSGRIELDEFDETTQQYSYRGRETMLYTQVGSGDLKLDAPEFISLNDGISIVLDQLLRYYPGINVDVDVFSDIVNRVSLDGQTFFDAFDALANDAVTPVYWGVKVDINGVYTFYFKEYVDANTRSLSRFDPSFKTFNLQKITRDLTTRLLISSTTALDYPQLFSNGSFETYDEYDGNELSVIDSSFESGHSWIVTAGASIKNTGADGNTVEARSGNSVLEIDNANEKAAIASFHITAGVNYRFKLWAKPEINVDLVNPPYLRLEVEWYTVTNTLISTDTFFTDPSSVTLWAENKFNAVAPPTARRMILNIVGHNAGGIVWGAQKGIHVDDVLVSRVGYRSPQGWQITSIGNPATSNADYRIPLVGAYDGIVSVIVHATAVDANNCAILAFRNMIPAAGGQQFFATARIKSVPTFAWPDLQFVVEFYRPDPNANNPPILISTFTSTISIASPADYVVASTQFVAPLRTTMMRCYYKIIETGSVQFDGLSLRDYRGGQDLDFYGDSVFIKRLSQTLLPGTPYDNGVATYGIREYSLSGDFGKTVAEAEEAGRVWLRSNLGFIDSPRIVQPLKLEDEKIIDIETKMRITEIDTTFPVDRIDVTTEEGAYVRTINLNFTVPGVETILINNKQKVSGFLKGNKIVA